MNNEIKNLLEFEVLVVTNHNYKTGAEFMEKFKVEEGDLVLNKMENSFEISIVTYDDGQKIFSDFPLSHEFQYEEEMDVFDLISLLEDDLKFNSEIVKIIRIDDDIALLDLYGEIMETTCQEIDWTENRSENHDEYVFHVLTGQSRHNGFRYLSNRDKLDLLVLPTSVYVETWQKALESIIN